MNTHEHYVILCVCILKNPETIPDWRKKDSVLMEV